MDGWTDGWLEGSRVRRVHGSWVSGRLQRIHHRIHPLTRFPSLPSSPMHNQQRSNGHAATQPSSGLFCVLVDGETGETGPAWNREQDSTPGAGGEVRPWMEGTADWKPASIFQWLALLGWAFLASSPGPCPACPVLPCPSCPVLSCLSPQPLSFSPGAGGDLPALSVALSRGPGVAGCSRLVWAGAGRQGEGWEEGGTRHAGPRVPSAENEACSRVIPLWLWCLLPLPALPLNRYSNRAARVSTSTKQQPRSLNAPLNPSTRQPEQWLAQISTSRAIPGRDLHPRPARSVPAAGDEARGKLTGGQVRNSKLPSTHPSGPPPRSRSPVQFVVPWSCMRRSSPA